MEEMLEEEAEVMDVEGLEEMLLPILEMEAGLLDPILLIDAGLVASNAGLVGGVASKAGLPGGFASKAGFDDVGGRASNTGFDVGGRASKGGGGVALNDGLSLPGVHDDAVGLNPPAFGLSDIIIYIIRVIYIWIN